MTGAAGVVVTVGAFVGQLDVITWCVPSKATATNTPLANVTEFQLLASAAVWAVHVTPSGDVITRCVPLKATATNTPQPNVTDAQPLASAAVWAVHVTPSGDVITSCVPFWATATNTPLPNVTEDQVLLELPAVGLHVLRHSAAARMIQAGAAPKTVQAILGHRSAAFTLTVYGHLFDTDLDDLAARLDSPAAPPRPKVVALDDARRDVTR